MNRVNYLRLALLLFITPLSLTTLVHADDNSGLCRISLKSLSHRTARAGDEIELFGKWGSSRGEKVPVINKGRMNTLEVLSWSNDTIRARIPTSLSTGDYKVGVYCRPLSRGSTGSSGFKTLRIEPSLSTAPTPKSTLRPIRTEKSYEEPFEEEVKEKSLLEEYWWFIFMIPVYLLLQRKTERPAPGMPAGGMPTGAIQSEPKKLPPSGKAVGVPYTVDSYDGETVTIEIEPPSEIAYKLEIDAREAPPEEIDPAIKSQVSKLLKIGVNYIDINFNTDRIAAEIPRAIIDNDNHLVKDIVVQLIMIKKLVRKK